VAPVEGRVWTFAAGKPINTDQPIQIVDLPGEREHQCKGMLGASDVSATAHTQHFDSTCLAGSYINIPKDYSIFVNDFKTWCQSEFFGANLQGLSDDCFRRFEIIMQFRFGANQPNFAGVERARRISRFIAPAPEIRQIGRHKICERSPSFRAGGWIEDHSYQASPSVVFHHHYRLS